MTVLNFKKNVLKRFFFSLPAFFQFLCDFQVSVSLFFSTFLPSSLRSSYFPFLRKARPNRSIARAARPYIPSPWSTCQTGRPRPIFRCPPAVEVYRVRGKMYQPVEVWRHRRTVASDVTRLHYWKYLSIIRVATCDNSFCVSFYTYLITKLDIVNAIRSASQIGF